MPSKENRLLKNFFEKFILPKSPQSLPPAPSISSSSSPDYKKESFILSFFFIIKFTFSCKMIPIDSNP
jgi:hypothetical protein